MSTNNGAKIAARIVELQDELDDAQDRCTDKNTADKIQAVIEKLATVQAEAAQLENNEDAFLIQFGPRGLLLRSAGEEEYYPGHLAVLTRASQAIQRALRIAINAERPYMFDESEVEAGLIGVECLTGLSAELAEMCARNGGEVRP